jgi:hypothetical protein
VCVVFGLLRKGIREPRRDARAAAKASWSKDDKSGAAMINAKAETVAEKPAYRAAFKARPCLVIADGFYEWAKVGPKEKQPYFITTKGRAPFAFAGLWEWWRAKTAPADDPGLETFTILTTEPNELCAPIRDHEARPRLERRTIGGLIGNCLRLGVDHRRAAFVVLRPAGHEHPTHDHRLAAALLVKPHHDAALHGREVKARFEIGDWVDVGLGDAI